MKNKIFIAIDTKSLNKAKSIIDQVNLENFKIGYKFGLEFVNSKNGRNFISKLKKKIIFIDLKLNDIPLGSVIHNIELFPSKGASLARSAGSFAQLVAKEGKYGTIKLPSGEMRLVLLVCRATIGSVSNSNHMNTRLGKAGRNRWLGRRPRVRAVAMNPVDHPMGGGEGKASGGHPRSRNGLYSKGLKTRKKNKYSDKLIIKKRK